MSTYNSISWLPLAGGLTLLGLILSWVAWRRRGIAAGLRGVAWSLLPLAAYLTGAIKMLWQMGAAIGDFASSFVFSPRVWSGVIVAGAAGVLFAVSGGLRRVRRRKSGGDAAADQPQPAGQPARAAQPADQGAQAGQQAARSPPRRRRPGRRRRGAPPDGYPLTRVRPGPAGTAPGPAFPPGARLAGTSTASGSGRAGGVPPNAGQMGLCAHQSHSRPGRGRQSRAARARSMACQTASTLRSVARRSASSGSYRTISPLPR